MFGHAWVGAVYEAARDAWRLDDAELAQIAHAGVSASFADDMVKREIGFGIDRWLETARLGEPSGLLDGDRVDVDGLRR